MLLISFLEIELPFRKKKTNCTKNALSGLINPDHTDFIKGRFIGESIRLIDSVIRFAPKGSIAELLLLVDFEKVFETLEWNFLLETLQ